MNMRTKTGMKTAMLTAALALTAATFAYADSNPANDSGSFTVRITPNVDLGVTVDTTGANWAGPSTNLDMTSNLAADTLLEAPVTVTMAGNFANQELTLTGVALNTWTLNAADTDVVDQLRLYGMFSFDSGVALDAIDFTTVDLITAAPKRAGQPQADEAGDTNHVYELLNAHLEADDVDGMAAGNIRSLWLLSRTPSTSTTDQQAAFTVIVSAVSGAGL